MNSVRNMMGLEDIPLFATRSGSTDIDSSDGSLREHDCRAPGDALEIGCMPDQDSGYIGETFHWYFRSAYWSVSYSNGWKSELNDKGPMLASTLRMAADCSIS